MKNRKIIFTVTNDLTYDQRMQKICRSLTSAGYEVELVGRLRSFSAPAKSEPFSQTRLKCIFNKGKLFYAEYNLRLLWYLLFQRFDAVCAIDLDTIVSCYIAGKFKNAKLVYDAHEYFTEVPEVVNRGVVKNIWQWVEKTFVPRYHLCYTVSVGVANLFYNKYHIRFQVIMNVPVWKEQFKCSEVQERTLLYQGALNEGRGLEHVLEAMLHIDGKLKLAGEGDLSHKLREFVVHHQLQDKVEFLGFVAPEQLRVVTQNAYIGLNPQANKGLSYYHSLGNKFFDYIHAGLPQVCTKFPEYERVNNEFEVAVMVESDSTDEIRMGVERLLNDKELYQRLQKNCEVCSRVYNWQNEEKKLISLYHELFR